MLTDDFKKERASLVRDLADRADDPFIKRRLLDLVSRYEIPVAMKSVTPISIGWQTKAESERD
ncbi:hypothetical protein [Bradyrhizobium sp. OAE829]|uniref:hypothetical protein n=1 Tax=Bradyrhizobium sp. OAE829 TaxID=2663807 RepID=UPI00178B49AE